MPLNQSRLANSIENLVFSNISAEFPAKRQPDLQKFSKAVAAGVVGYYTGAKGSIQSTGLGGTTTGLNNLNPSSMAATMRKFCVEAFNGSGGVALDFFCKGISDAVCNEFNFVTIQGTDSGTASQFQNGSFEKMAQLIESSIDWPGGPFQMPFFLAISHAIYSEILEKGTAEIPFSGSGSAGSIATMS